MKKVFLEFRQLAGGGHGGAVDQKGRQNLLVAVLLGMQIQHEVDQGPFKPGSKTGQQREAGPGDLGSPLKIEDAEIGAKFPMLLRFV